MVIIFKSDSVMDGILKILFVEDVKSDAELIWHEIKGNNIPFSKLLVESEEDYIKGLKDFQPDMIISDYSLPQFNGITALKLRNELAPYTPFILVTGSVNEEVAVDCMKAGADDYILKENLSRLGLSIANSINKIKLEKEKKKAEEELSKSELRLKKAQSIAHVGNWELDLSTKNVWCSEEAFKIYGYKNNGNEMPLSLVQKFPLPEFRPILDEAFDRLLKYNEPYEAEFKIKRPGDGEVRSIYSKAEILHEHESEKIIVVGVIQDITERKLAEEALRESENKYRRIFDNVQDLYYEAKLDGTIIEVSPSIAILSKGQYTRAALVGRSMYDFYSDSHERNSLLTSLKESGSVTDFEIMLKNSDGSLIPCSVSSKIVLDCDGNPEKIVGSMRDISNRKRAEEELIRAKQKAEESDRLKTAFLHNISHEIRTPMNAIVGFATLLAEPDVDTQTRQSYTEVIMQSSNHLLSIITDIVDISNVEANLAKAVKNEINVNSTLKNIYDQFVIRASGLKLDFSYQTDLSDSESLILTDNTKLTQIISNLLNNAFKFTYNGYVRFGYVFKNDILEFFVSDTGIGIPETHHVKIFDRFYQVESKKTRVYEGTGLGLAISKAYVELLGGRIWLSSESGIGTTFYFTIPVEKQVQKSLADSEKTIVDGFVFAERKTILVAEDIDSNFKLISYFLSRANITVLRAINGREAVDKVLVGEKIDLILMDVKMPVMDGYTAVKLIREKNRDIPIIAQTAYADDIEKAVECGCSGFISKPFDKKSLLKAMSEFI